MIKLIPLEDKKALSELCAAYEIELTPDVHAYVSATPQIKARCIFCLTDYNVQLLALETDSEDPLIPELLIRAVGAYAANRSGYLFKINKNVGQAIDSTLKTLHFEENAEEYIGKIPKVLAGSCHCNHQ